MRRLFSRLFLPGFLSEPSDTVTQGKSAKSVSLFGSVSALSAWLDSQPGPIKERSISPGQLRRWLVAVSSSIWQLSGNLEAFSAALDKKVLARLAGDPAEAELTALQARAAALRERVLQLYQMIRTVLEQMPLSPSLSDQIALEGQIQSQLSAIGAQIGVFISDWTAWQASAMEGLARSSTPQRAGWRALGWLGILGRAALILALGTPLLLIPQWGTRLYGILAFVVLLYAFMGSLQGRWAACPVCGELVGPFFAEEKIRTCECCGQPLILWDDRVYTLKGLKEAETQPYRPN
jgi:hypothetical protein